MNFIKMVTVSGAPLYVYQMSRVRSAAIGVLIKAGSRDEKWPKEAGLAHAMEHMVFRGTEDFADSRILSAYVENTGGSLNACTSSEATFFHNRVPADQIERSIHSLSQLVRKPLFRQEDVKVEMDAIVQESRMYNDDPDKFLFIRFNEIIYGDHPVGLNTLGTENSVLNFQPSDFRVWQEKFYHPGNLAFLAVGNFKSEDIQDLFGRYFPETIVRFGNQRAVSDSARSKANFEIVYRSTEQAYLVLGVLIPKANYPELRLFKNMICGGTSSPLFQEVRDKRGLAYSVGAFCDSYSDIGEFLIYIGTDPRKVEEAVKVGLEVITQSKDSVGLLNVAKEMTIGSLSLSTDNPYNILQKAAHDLTENGRIVSLEEEIEKIKAITIKQVSQAVEKYLLPKTRRVLAVLGPEEIIGKNSEKLSQI